MKPQPQDQTQMLTLMLGMDIMDADTTDMDTMDIHTDTTMVRDLLMSLLLLVQTLMLMLMLIMDMLDTTDADTMDIHTDMDTTMARDPLMRRPQLQVQTQMLMLMPGVDMDTILMPMDTDMATMDIHTDTTGAESKQTKTDVRHLPT